MDELTTSLRDIAGSLQFDPLSDQGVVEQFERQLALEIAGLEDEMDALGAALGAAPVDYVQTSSTITALQESVERTQAAGIVAQGHVQAAAQETNPVTVALELGQALVAGKAAVDAGAATLQLIADARADAEATLGPAFDRAPECAG